MVEEQNTELPRENQLIWRLVRKALRVLFHRSSNRVLLSRPLVPSRSAKRRWLPNDISEFISEVELQVDFLRPTANLVQFTAFGNRLMVELSIYTVSAYRVLLDRGFNKADASSTVSDIGWDIYSKMLRFSSLFFRMTTSNPELRIKRTIRMLLKFPFSAPGKPGYGVEVSENKGDLLTHFTHCPPQTFVREVIRSHGDLDDLDAFYKSWCLYDWAGADIIAGDNRIGHYQRSMTLSKGDPVCDMCWMANPVAEDQPGTKLEKASQERNPS